VNWEALGAVAELIGAVGVIGSLIYLAVQIRQNTRSLRASAYQAITGHVGDINRALFENAEVAHIVEVGSQDRARLSPEERRRFNAYQMMRFMHYDNLYRQYAGGMLEKSRWHASRRILASSFQQPGVVAWWRESSRAFGDEFVTEVNSLLERVSERTRCS
jgi:hypothetical protein